ncbi:hypothetical protein PHLCEN_2v13069 [Hermanssonia centrifuga]|uniref:Uncharacterized protein n=1 Tax=Hermanssonia centrifuga TaxID=98765 RepID=A0A2R6NFD8_9APHY|nr:hypothetical protein PHLCEN_2v13069 [Hermanssonia centrifuga]
MSLLPSSTPTCATLILDNKTNSSEYSDNYNAKAEHTMKSRCDGQSGAVGASCSVCTATAGT